MKKYFYKLAQFIVAAYVLTFSVVISYVAADLFIRPVTIIDLTIQTPEVKAGNNLTVTVEYERHKACKSEIDRFFVHRLADQTYEVVFRQQNPGVIIMGHDHVTVSVPVPANVSPGEYTFVQYLISYCAAITRVDYYPEHTFRVLPP